MLNPSTQHEIFEFLAPQGELKVQLLISNVARSIVYGGPVVPDFQISKSLPYGPSVNESNLPRTKV